MSKTPSSLLVCIADRLALIKITGRATFSSSVSFKLLVNELRESGFNDFLLDLGECVTMDSTFLGVLAGMALKLGDGKTPDRRFSLQLLNPNQRVSDLLENLGVAHLFNTIHSADQQANYEPASQGDMSPSRKEISETCLEAHQILMAINPDNIPKFKDVTQFLAEDLKRLKGEKPAPVQHTPAEQS